MASLVDSQKFASRVKLTMWDHDPGATTAKLVSPDGGTTVRYIDMATFEGAVVAAYPTAIGGGGLTKLEIVAATDAAFTTPVVVKDSGVIAADALGDWAMLECTAEEVAHLGAGLRYVTGRLTQGTATDEAVVVLMGIGPRFGTADLTAEKTIA